MATRRVKKSEVGVLRIPTPRKAWSYSHWVDYCNCPALYSFKRVLNMPEAERAASSRGLEIHHEVDQWFKGARKEIPNEMIACSMELEQRKKWGANSECELALTEQWKPTGWFDPDVWMRSKIDIVTPRPRQKLLIIDDVKTGKISREYQDQCENYAVAGFLSYPKVEIIQTGFLYANFGAREGVEYRRKELKALQKKWRNRAVLMLNDAKCLPTENKFCGWCGYSKKKGGPCPIR